MTQSGAPSEGKKSESEGHVHSVSAPLTRSATITHVTMITIITIIIIIITIITIITMLIHGSTDGRPKRTSQTYLTNQ